MTKRWCATLVIALGLGAYSCGGDGADGAPGPQGPPGTTGKQGPPGAEGGQGPQGEDGDPGPTGKTGPKGDQGDQGDKGDQGDQGVAGEIPAGTLNASCMLPCHSFSGIVDQWKTSRHFAAYVANLDGEEVDSWTGAKACGNCHASDGIEQRVAGNVGHGTAGAGPVNLADGQLNYKDGSSIKEITYAGQTTVAVVGCNTCHAAVQNDPHLTGDDYTSGDFKLRVPTGAGDHVIIERSSAVTVSDGTEADNFQAGNACMWCHKSRKDVTNYIVTTNNISSTTWGPHEGPQADIYSGKGGYEYAGQVYGSGAHSGFRPGGQYANHQNGCVDCHMPPVESNMGIGDHSFYPQLSVCKECHGNNITDFDVNDGQSDTKDRLRELRTLLNGNNFLTRDGLTNLTDEQLADDDFQLDEALPSSVVEANQTVPADIAGALYNYFLIARGAALSVHNTTYTRNLLDDSIDAVPPID